MATDDKIVEIKLEVDTSDVDKAMKNVVKSADKMAKDVEKAGDKAEDSFEDLGEQLKDVTKEMKNLAKNINLNALTSSVNKAMNQVKKTVDKTVTDIKKQFQNAFSIKGDVQVNVTGGSSEDAQGAVSDATSLIGQAMTSGAMGSNINKNLAQTGDMIEDTMDGIGETMSDTMDNVGDNISDSMDNVGTNIRTSMIDTGRIIEDSMGKTGLTMSEMGQRFTQQFIKIQSSIAQTGGEALDLEKQLNQLVIRAIHFQNAMAFGEGGNILGYTKLREQLDEVILAMDMAGLETDEFTKQFRNLKMVLEEREGKAIKVVDSNSMKDITDLTNSVLDCINQMDLGFNGFSKKVNSYFKQVGYSGKTMVGDLKESQKTISDTTHEIEKHTQSQNQASRSNTTLGNTTDKLTDSMHDLADSYKSVNNEQEKTAKSTKKTEGAFKQMFDQIAPYLKVAAIFASIQKSITSYTDSLQDSSKFSLMFGSEAQNMTEWLNELNSTVTVSKSTLMDFSGNMFRMGKNMDMSTEQAIKMSKEMTELGADLVALTGDINIMDALAGAMRGEMDSLENFGFILSDAAIEAEALKHGFDLSTDSGKALAIQAVIVGQSMHALGYGAEQAKTLGGQLVMLRKNFSALGTAIGSCFAGLLQVILPVLNRIVSAVTEAFNQIASVINSIFGIFGIKVGGGASTGGSGGGLIGEAMSDIGDGLASGLSEASNKAGDVADSLKDGANAAKEIMKELMGVDEINNLTPKETSGGSGSGGSGGAGGGAGDSGVGGSLGDMADGAEDASDKAKEEGEEVAEWIKILASNLLAVWNMLKAGWLSVSDYISESIANLKQAFFNLGSSIQEFLLGAWNNGGAELVFNFGRLGGAITGAIIDISGQCVQMVADLFSYLNPETNPYTQAFIEGLNDLLIECQNFALNIGKWFGIFVDNGGQAFLNVIGDIIMILGTTLAKTFATAIKWVTTFMNSWAGQTLIKTCAKILNVLAGALKLVLIAVEKLSPVWSALLLTFVINSATNKTITFFTKLGSTIKKVVGVIKAQMTGGLVGALGKALTSIKTFVYSTINAFNLMKQGVVGASLAAEVGKLPALFATAITSVKAWAVAMKGATVAQTAMNVAGSITAGIMGVLTSPITLVIGAIVALIAIVDQICQYFFNWEGIISWLGEKLGWLWDKIKSFFGWDGENKIDDEMDYTSDSLNGLGDTMEQVSDRFGTSCSAINESLASIGIDGNKLALQLDEAEASFNEKFSMMSKKSQEYLQAIADGNEEVMNQMAGDADACMADIIYTFNNMSVQEQALWYATYGEIEGVTDGWLDYTTGSYDECLAKHSGMMLAIKNNELIGSEEKTRLMNEEVESFKKAMDSRENYLEGKINEINAMEWQSEEDRYNAVKQYSDELDLLRAQMTENEIGYINDAEDAVLKSTELQEGAYDGVADSQTEALEGVDKSLETTKGNLSSFKEESDKVAKEIPKEWEGIGETISDEFEGALDGIKTNFTGILNNTQKQCNQLKSGLQATFNDVKTGVKKSMDEVNKTIKTKFTEAVNSVKTAGNNLKTSLQSIFQNISSGLTTSFTNIKNSMTNAFKSMSTSITSTMNSCKNTITNTLNSINTQVKSKTTAIKNTVSTTFNSLAKTFTSPFTTASKTITDSLTTMNTTIGSRLKTIVSTLQSYATKMKNTMNFNFPTPYLRMPHISVYGDWNFEKKTVPSFRVNWWSSGAIFNKRTILGNMGVGDAQNGYGNNPEAVLPLDSLWKELNVQFQKQNQALKNNNQPIQVNLYLDGKVVTSTVIDNMKDQSKRGVLDTSWL